MLSVAERLEQASWNLFWIPETSVVLERPELLAFATPGAGAMLNVGLRLRAPAADLPALVDEVSTLHGQSPSRWQVTDTFDSQPLEQAIAAAGYEPAFEHDVRVVSASEFRARPRGGFRVERVTTTRHLRDSYVVSEQAFGSSGRVHDEQRELAEFRDPSWPANYFVAYDGDEPVSGGGINIYSDLRLAFLWAGGTVPSARGRGAYSAVVAARVAFAAAAGASDVGLYARTQSSSPIVAAQGFERRGTMTFWERG